MPIPAEPPTKRTKYIFVPAAWSRPWAKGWPPRSSGSCWSPGLEEITIQKLDPYLNVDPGTMNPQQHGEVFVTDDGAETDLDLGHYERFLSADVAAEQQPPPVRSTCRSSRRSAAGSTWGAPSR